MCSEASAMPKFGLHFSPVPTSVPIKAIYNKGTTVWKGYYTFLLILHLSRNNINKTHQVTITLFLFICILFYTKCGYMWVLRISSLPLQCNLCFYADLHCRWLLNVTSILVREVLCVACPLMTKVERDFWLGGDVLFLRIPLKVM